MHPYMNRARMRGLTTAVAFTTLLSVFPPRWRRADPT